MVGTADKACCAAETAPCTFAAEMPVLWPTAAACAAGPPALVLCGGEVNGVTVVANADAPA